MKVISVNVGLPRLTTWQGKAFETGIFKEAVVGPVEVMFHNLDGDRQADLSVHGGPYKAVYAYPFEHYSFWKQFLGVVDLPFGSLGENLTVEGVLESDLSIGDQLQIGTAQFVVTQPRVPCFKLAARHGRSDIVKEFFQSGKSGFYLKILQPGQLQAGDSIKFIRRDPAEVSVSDITKIQRGEARDFELLRRASSVKDLAPGTRESILSLLEELD